jgi:hypothetical protein
MSKKASPALFELISSMSKSEKRYFKLFASRHTIGEENNYIRIFDFIESQDSFNDEEIHSHFKGEAFLNKFSITKNRLYDQIMKSLDSFHSGASIDAQIYKLLHGGQILYNKGLYDHAKRQLTSANKLAKKHNRDILIQEIAIQQKKLIETEGYKNHNLEDLEKVRLEDKENQLHSQYYNELWFLKSKLFNHMNKKGKSRSDADLKLFNAIFQSYDKLKRPKKMGFETEYLANHFESAYYFAILNTKMSLKYLEKNLNLIKNTPKAVQSTPNKYFSIITNIIHLESASGNYKNVHQYLKELKSFKEKYKINSSEDLDIKLFSSINSIELMIHIQRAEFEKAIVLEPIIQEGFRLYNDAITPLRKAYLSFNLAVAFFGVDDFNKSLHWVNNVLNNSELDEKEDIIAFAQILNLIIHFELKNDQLLPYALKSTMRFLKKRDRSYKFETIFLKQIRKISNANDRFEVEQIFADIEKEVEEIANDPFESVALEYFDFKSWLKSKLKKQSFKVIKRESFLAQAS